MFGSSQAFGGSQVSATASDAKRAFVEDRQICLPVSIKQIDVAVAEKKDGEELMFFGEEAGMLLIVGTVESLARQAAILEMCIGDSTGRIRARAYLSAAQQQQLEALAPGHYVSLFGMVRTAPALHFAAAGVRMVKSADEISYHMVEVAHAALRLMAHQAENNTNAVHAGLPVPTFGAIAPEPPFTPAKRERDGAEESPPKGVTIKAEGCASVKAEPGTQKGAAQGKVFSGPGLRAAIVAYMQQECENRAEGISLEMVRAHLSPTPAADVKAGMDELVDDGEVFSTIDEEHFNCL